MIMRKLAALIVVGVAAFGLHLARADDTPKAAETRKKLATKIDVEYNDTSLSDVVADLKEKVPALGIRLDVAGGVSRNLKFTYKAKQKTLADVLDGMFQKNGYGYVVTSKEGDAYDGSIFVKQGKERGYAVGEEPTKGNAKEVATKTAKKTAALPKTKNTETDDAASANPEQQAALKLRLAKDVLKDGKKARAKERLEDIVAKFPDTKAAEEARQILKDLNP